MFTPPRSRALKPKAHPNIPPSSYRSHGGPIGETRMEEMSDSEVSSCAPSPCLTRERCFCGRDVSGMEGGIYCSVACARSDAFSSLCYKSGPLPSAPLASTSFTNQPPAPLSRNPSIASTASTEDWTASHYRRLARAESRRDERREERRRRRAENISTSSRSTVMSTSSSASRNVPELVGGHYRNASTASTVSTAYTIASLSRNPSSASTTSSRRYGGMHVNSVIMEDEDEEEWMKPVEPKPYATPHRTHRRKGSASGLSQGRKKRLEGLGMGKDMRDVLEEIIRMEKGFSLPDQNGDRQEADDLVPPGLYTAAFDRPPRTPEPMVVDRKTSQAPGAPKVHRRSSVSHHGGPPFDITGDLLGLPPLPPTTNRPSSFMGHQSSLSESHTALYLATASPAQAKINPFDFINGPNPERKSASPQLQDRKSLTFTPEADAPHISTFPFPSFSERYNTTPSRRHASPAPYRPAMDGWRFPSSVGSQRTRSQSENVSVNSDTATPTRPPPINTNVPNPSLSTPQRQSPTAPGISAPQLLWPPNGMIPPPLAPALFPCSPANATPDFLASGHVPPGGVPGSGMTLGSLLGSGDDDEDVDMDDGSTDRGHGQGYLPVFLEAEGFRSEGSGW